MARFGEPASGLSSKSSPTDLVSDADREAEAAITEMLAVERPDDGILAEEGTAFEGSSGRRWVLDPLDGTTNFLHSYPAWSVSIALEDAAGAITAVVHDPPRGETFRAQRGSGCELNRAPVRVRENDELSMALIATGFGYEASVRAAQADTLRELLPLVRDIRRAGSAALDLAWVAAGRLDGYYQRGLKPWDSAAGVLLVREAGGDVRELPGDPPVLVASSDRLSPKLSELLVNSAVR